MRALIESLEGRFIALHERSVALLRVTSDRDLYRRPRDLDQTLIPFSVGEYVLRSAAVAEQTFGGITSRLWDDPFEWTLPEKLSTTKTVLEYLQEVDETRRKAFGCFAGDDDLLKSIPAPEELRTIFDLLLGTIARAEHYQGRAFGLFQVLSNTKLPHR